MDSSAVARDVFDVQQLRSEQTEAIEAILRLENVIAVLPTGFGKSLCYQVGTVMLKGFTVVVTPLLALCEDQIEYMSAHGIPVARMDSTIECDEQEAVCSRVAADDSGLKALYTTPETLQHNKQQARALRVAQAAENINFITIDEAHCVLEWSEFRYDLEQCTLCLAGLGTVFGTTWNSVFGTNCIKTNCIHRMVYRPEYAQLRDTLRCRTGERPIVALTATATPQALGTIRALHSNARGTCIVRAPMARLNLFLKLERKAAETMEDGHLIPVGSCCRQSGQRLSPAWCS